MSRWENEDVSNLNLPDPDIPQETFFGKDGTVTTNDKGLAKVVRLADKDTFYLKHGRGEILDPYSIDTFRHNGPSFKFKRVSQASFDAYMRYLNTHNRLYFTQARRLIMENVK
tara:strand:- start:9052 stop:9390 length:339 start_codon:yes stop_codon:yes gene_type:complete